MRFESLKIGRFGTLRDLDSGAESLPNLVAVLGPNEAGKSTLFRALTSILYGFSPAQKDRHPYSGTLIDRSICLIWGCVWWYGQHRPQGFPRRYCAIHN